jgi:hypothetical protein
MAYAKPESSLAQNDGAMQSNIQNRRATSGVRDARHPSLVRSWDGAFRQSDGRGFGVGWRSPVVAHHCLCDGSSRRDGSLATGRCDVIGAFEDSRDGAQGDA